jgi:hypothetical protein
VSHLAGNNTQTVGEGGLLKDPRGVDVRCHVSDSMAVV